ncbi:unnamed protein product [Penicillium palitans]
MMLTKSLQEIRSLRTTRFTRLLYRSSSKEWDNHDREDIEDALKHPEPSAIKGAFSIPPPPTSPDENSMASNVPPQLKGATRPTVDQATATPKAQAPPAPVAARKASISQRIRGEQTQADSDSSEEPRPSHIRILPTSLPYVHEQLMEQRDREQSARIDEVPRKEASRSEADGHGSQNGEPSPEEQAATV